MIRLDTIKLQIPNELVKSFPPEIFTKSQKADFLGGNEVNFIQAKSDFLPVGVSKILCKEGREWQVTMSAKTLKDNYLQGITTNTYPQMIETLNEVLQVDANEVWDSNPKVLLCDTTDNITLAQLGGTQLEVCRSVLASKGNDRFVNKFYHSAKKLGVEFAGTQETKNRIILYSKNLDLQKPQNRNFIRALHNPVKIISEAEKQIRVETNHTTLGSVRDRFKINDNNLQSILGSEAKVNYEFLNKVIKNKEGQLDIFVDIKESGLRGLEFIQYYGILWIIKECAGDALKVRQVFKELFPNETDFKYHFYKRKNSIKELIKRVNIENTGELKERVNEITNKLLKELLAA